MDWRRCVLWALTALSTSGLHLDLCETAFSVENCHQNMPMDKLRAYPRIGLSQRMFFKVSGEPEDPDAVLWPFRCHLVETSETGTREAAIVIDHGCPSRGGMAVYMSMRPVRVEFLLGEMLIDREARHKQLAFRCLVVECHDTPHAFVVCRGERSDSVQRCPKERHCENSTLAAELTRDWEELARPARTRGHFSLKRPPSLR